MAMLSAVERVMPPSAQTTVVFDSAHEPREGSALTKLTPGGSVSRTITPVASLGPRFCTETL